MRYLPQVASDDSGAVGSLSKEAIPLRRQSVTVEWDLFSVVEVHVLNLEERFGYIPTVRLERLNLLDNFPDLVPGENSDARFTSCAGFGTAGAPEKAAGFGRDKDERIGIASRRNIRPRLERGVRGAPPAGAQHRSPAPPPVGSSIPQPVPVSCLAR